MDGVVSDGLDAVSLGLFLFGLVFALVGAVAGHVEAGHDAAGHDHDGIPFSSTAALAFVAWFGGVTYLVRRGFGWTVPVAILAGVIGGGVAALLVGRFVRLLMGSHSIEMGQQAYRLPGTLGHVSSPIREGGTGEVIYEQAGVRQVIAARAAGDRRIERGTDVIVLRTDRGVAVVEPFDESLSRPEEIRR